MDWTDILASEFTEENEMSMLTAKFGARMRKRVVDSDDESTPIYDGKHPRLSSLDEDPIRTMQ